MELRTEVTKHKDGTVPRLLKGTFAQNIDALDHDALAAHALMRALEGAAKDKPKFAEWIKIRADEIMAEWIA